MSSSAKEIVTGVQNTVEMISRIAAASEEQSATSEQISRSVEAISTVSGESAQGISQIAYSSDGLSGLTDDLRQLVAQFRIDRSSPDAPASVRLTVAGDGYDGRAAIPGA